MPTPAETSATGPLPARVNVPRGAAASMVCPTRTESWMRPLATPCGSCFTLMR